MSTGYFNAPKPLESNPPIVPQFYQPGVYYITAIGLGNITTVTTNVANQYVIGQQVRFVIPSTFGTRELNEKSGFVQNILSPTQFQVNVDSHKYNAFIASPAYGPTLPQVVAIGDLNSGVFSNSNGRVLQGTTIPGANINTSPIEGTWLN